MTPKRNFWLREPWKRTQTERIRGELKITETQAFPGLEKEILVFEHEFNWERLVWVLRCLGGESLSQAQRAG